MWYFSVLNYCFYFRLNFCHFQATLTVWDAIQAEPGRNIFPSFSLTLQCVRLFSFTYSVDLDLSSDSAFLQC